MLVRAREDRAFFNVLCKIHGTVSTRFDRDVRRVRHRFCVACLSCPRRGLLQAGLGVATLLALAPIGLALAHQAFALALFGLAVAHLRATEIEQAA